MIIGDDEYKTEVTLPAFAKKQLEPRGFNVTFVCWWCAIRTIFSGLVEALKTADLVLVSARRRTPLERRLDALRAPLSEREAVGRHSDGKPRFFATQECAATGRIMQLGTNSTRKCSVGTIQGHHGEGIPTKVSLAPRAEKHPDFARGGCQQISRERFALLFDSAAGGNDVPSSYWDRFLKKKPRPWHGRTRLGRRGHASVYTSFGHFADFENPAFQKLLLNGICWTCRLSAPADKVAEVGSASGK